MPTARHRSHARGQEENEGLGSQQKFYHRNYKSFLFQAQSRSAHGARYTGVITAVRFLAEAGLHLNGAWEVIHPNSFILAHQLGTAAAAQTSCFDLWRENSSTAEQILTQQLQLVLREHLIKRMELALPFQQRPRAPYLQKPENARPSYQPRLKVIRACKKPQLPQRWIKACSKCRYTDLPLRFPLLAEHVRYPSAAAHAQTPSLD